ncbi:MAG: ammonia-forming cytochrome c nitrite reductase subunit c552 [Pseudomonadota bacterium]
MTRNSVLWLVWLLGTLVAGVAVASVMYIGGSRDALLIGETSGAHHQIELACGACHAADPFATPKKTAKAMNKACLSCHKDELKLSNDSHPVKKFRDPRNADVRAKLDALYCHTCHAEHKPEITRVSAVTLPMDYCAACHQDVYKNRPSHEGYGFGTCASAGCHNFHDNTALYEDFLVKHAGGPDVKEAPVLADTVARRDLNAISLALLSADPVQELFRYLAAQEDAPDDSKGAAAQRLSRVLSPADARAPEAYLTAEAIDHWAGSAHALSGVNCAGCHAPKAEGLTEIAAVWVESPDLKICQSCHKDQAKTFKEGRHGMRFHPKLPKPRKPPKNGIEAYLAEVFTDEPLGPLTVAESRLTTLKPEAAGREIGSCGTCHKPHDVDLEVAAVEACAGCHDDNHTRAYFSSSHHDLWQAELAGAAPGTGVTCAACHMPKIENRRGDLFTTHNQNAYLRPSEKMIRTVCMSCHSLDFAIDALADPELVETNFNGRPAMHVESIDWALKRVKKDP